MEMTLPAVRRVGLWSRLRHGHARVYADASWPEFAGADWLEQIMTVDVQDRLHRKQGRSIARWTLSSQTERGNRLVVYLKRHYVLPRLHGWLTALFPRLAWSPGWAEWGHLEWSASVGLPVPRVLAAGEQLGPWGRLTSFLAVEELTGMIGLHEAVPLASERLEPAEFEAWKRGLIIEMARLCRELHRRRHFHKDLYFCHFYVAEADTARPGSGIVPSHTDSSFAQWRGRVVMIDFHRLGRHRIGWQWYLVKDLAQLLFSSEVPGVTARDRLRFWKHYRGGEWRPVSAPGRWFEGMIRRKWQLYRRHHERKLRSKGEVASSKT